MYEIKQYFGGTSVMKSELKNIKLIIWDLDETFWEGTLSEGDVKEIPQNTQLIRTLSEKGIVNSICSKNDFEPAKEKLEEINIWDYFVFASISWEQKGARIKNMIEEMGLRPVNVLFIDDNHMNLKEAEFVCPDISTCSEKEIPELIAEAEALENSDKELKRLSRYKILEEKSSAKSSFDSNEDFLYASCIRVDIFRDCEKELDRIHELIMRTNRLNFTKIRLTPEELAEIVKDKSYDCGYVNVSDKYGDYGIVGFFAVRDGKAEHFLFSCRTLGMGIEQYVYASLGSPEVKVTGEISGELKKDVIPQWINQETASETEKTAVKEVKDKILFKGPCDLGSILTYLSGNDLIETEFNEVNEKTGVYIKSANHTLHILQSRTMSDERKKEIINELVFSSDNFFDTNMFDGGYNIVFYSTFTDPMLGVYKRKSTGELVAFGDWCYDLTDENNRAGYISGEYDSANCTFTDETLDDFKSKYEYQGRLSIEKIVENLKEIRDILPKETLLVLMLGSEQEHLNNTQKAYENRHEFARELNDKIKKAFEGKDNVKFVCFNDFVTGQQDYLDSISHFSKIVYYKAAQRVIEIIEENTGKEIKRRSKLFLFATKILAKSKKNKTLFKIMLRLRKIIKKFIK